jgi:hypothetical protein
MVTSQEGTRWSNRYRNCSQMSGILLLDVHDKAFELIERKVGVSHKAFLTNTC